MILIGFKENQNDRRRWKQQMMIEEIKQRESCPLSGCPGWRTNQMGLSLCERDQGVSKVHPHMGARVQK